jgi:hypothetical protein
MQLHGCLNDISMFKRQLLMQKLSCKTLRARRDECGCLDALLPPQPGDTAQLAVQLIGDLSCLQTEFLDAITQGAEAHTGRCPVLIDGVTSCLLWLAQLLAGGLLMIALALDV